MSSLFAKVTHPDKSTEEVEFFNTGEEIERICIHDSYNIVEGWDKKGQRWAGSGYFCDGELYDVDEDTLECEELNERKYLSKRSI
jgi:hypothetical protein